MTDNYIHKVELKGIHKRYDLDVDFNDSLNILYGQNGSGKTTLIHIIANIANCDFIRFAFLKFKKIKVTYSNEAFVVVTQYHEGSETHILVETQTGKTLRFTEREAYTDVKEYEDERNMPGFIPELSLKIKEFVDANEMRHIDTSYFPAFRTMLEAWPSRHDSKRFNPGRRTGAMSAQQITMFARDLFGPFLPAINYPSPIDIELELRNEIRDCQLRIARYEGSVFSESFVKIFSALLGRSNTGSSSSSDELLLEISYLTAESNSKILGDFENNSNTYRELRHLVNQTAIHGDLKSSTSGALTVYRDALQERQSFRQNAFKQIEAYFSVVNSFLEKKELSYKFDERRRTPKVGLKFPDGSWSPIKVMSSGERQLLTMLYAVNTMSGHSAVLIDEPEISLHIDWQENLLEKMRGRLSGHQIIVCTHSPAIAADFDEYMKEIEPIFSDNSPEESGSLSDEDEDDF